MINFLSGAGRLVREAIYQEANPVRMFGVASVICLENISAALRYFPDKSPRNDALLEEIEGIASAGDENIFINCFAV